MHANISYDVETVFGTFTPRLDWSTFSASFTNAEGDTITMPCLRPPWGRLIALDATNGWELWAAQLAHSAQAVPITCRGKDGRQYVAVTAANFNGAIRGADGKLLSHDAIIAFALPGEPVS